MRLPFRRQKTGAGVAASILALLLSGCVSQPLQPTDPQALGFGVYALGMSARAIPKGFSCSKDEIDVDLSCLAGKRSGDTLEGHPVEELQLGFFDDRLHQIAVQTQKSLYTEIVQSLVKKHGAPRVKAAPYTDAAGATLSGKTSTWSLSKGVITAVEYCTPTLSCLSFESSDYTALVAGKRQAATR